MKTDETLDKFARVVAGNIEMRLNIKAKARTARKALRDGDRVKAKYYAMTALIRLHSKELLQVMDADMLVALCDKEGL